MVTSEPDETRLEKPGVISPSTSLTKTSTAASHGVGSGELDEYAIQLPLDDQLIAKAAVYLQQPEIPRRGGKAFSGSRRIQGRPWPHQQVLRRELAGSPVTAHTGGGLDGILALSSGPQKGCGTRTRPVAEIAYQGGERQASSRR